MPDALLVIGIAPLITSSHGDVTTLESAYTRLVNFFNELKAIAPQLNSDGRWKLILAKAMEKFKVDHGSDNYIGMPAPA